MESVKSKAIKPVIKPKPALPNGWIVRRSQSFPDHIYHFNTRTGKSSWDLETVGAPQEKKRKANSLYDSSRSEGSSLNEIQDSSVIGYSLHLGSSDANTPSESTKLNQHPETRKVSSRDTLPQILVADTETKKTDLESEREKNYLPEPRQHLECEEYVRRFEEIIKEPIRSILQSELEDQFGTLWETVVAIKPPWSISDIFACINRYWYLSFHHLPKKCHKAVKDLKDLFLKLNAEMPQLHELRSIIDECINFLSEISGNDAYGDLLHSPHALLEDLSADVLQSEAAYVQLNIEKDEMVIEKDEMVMEEKRQEIEQIKCMFDVIWNHMRKATGGLCDAFHTKHDICTPTATTLSNDKAMDYLRHLLKPVNRICEQISRVTNSSKVHTVEVKSFFISLIFYFSDLDLNQESEFDVEQKTFHKFCSTNRDFLKARYSEIDEFRTKLQECLPTEILD